MLATIVARRQTHDGQTLCINAIACHDNVSVSFRQGDDQAPRSAVNSGDRQAGGASPVNLGREFVLPLTHKHTHTRAHSGTDQLCVKFPGDSREMVENRGKPYFAC
ncbi:hypothetical protein LX32DRAFT_459134 [Colletotrichum zoysiae]|uniref:Uncharacterized protein n=1 Tax=Colletotrichum zoysiae TaxID=1216348 RepID=A0AAD9HDR8_9PEZI|nr:hypothetical protein LX32DRAFT_459134 [Colletotrichum zoysiae]